ncbi:hypothetical protein ACVXHA_20275 [Escherichia coli]
MLRCRHCCCMVAISASKRRIVRCWRNHWVDCSHVARCLLPDAA